MFSKDAIQGKQKILMFRKYEEEPSGDGAKLALQTSHTITSTRSTTQTNTKDGAVAMSQGLQQSIAIEAISTRDEVNFLLEQSVEQGFMLEVWEIDTGRFVEDEVAGTSGYMARYGRGYLDSWTTPDSVDGFETISTNMAISGALVMGIEPLYEDQENEIRYAYREMRRSS